MRGILGGAVAVLLLWTRLTCADLMRSSASDAVCWPESVRDLLLRFRDNHCLLHDRGDSIIYVGVREVVSVLWSEYHFAIRLLVIVDPAQSLSCVKPWFQEKLQLFGLLRLCFDLLLESVCS